MPGRTIPERIRNRQHNAAIRNFKDSSDLEVSLAGVIHAQLSEGAEPRFYGLRLPEDDHKFFECGLSPSRLGAAAAKLLRPAATPRGLVNRRKMCILGEVGRPGGAGSRDRSSSPREERLANMVGDLEPSGSMILSSLTQVGPAKPIGYLPLYTIRDVLQMDPYALAQDAKARGLSSTLFGPNQCCIKSGALYVFDKHSLESLMRSSTAILVATGWPLDPDQFVARIAREWIDHAHSIAPVIKRAFGDEPT